MPKRRQPKDKTHAKSPAARSQTGPRASGLPTGVPLDLILSRPVVVFFILLFMSTLIYSNTLFSSFHLDDRHILDSPLLREPSKLLLLEGARDFGYLSFALNYRFGGSSVLGFHLVNLVIHAASGFLVFVLVQLLAESLKKKLGREGEASPLKFWVPFLVAVLFVTHPIQTQAVSYIVQRFASLATLLYLLSLVFYLKWRLSDEGKRSRHLYYAGAIFAALLAMKTKQTAFTLPFTIVLVEALFFRSQENTAAGRGSRRWIAIAPFLAVWLFGAFPYLTSASKVSLGLGIDLPRETEAISRTSYLLTQFRVIVTYLRLLVIPIGQNVDYDYSIYSSFLNPNVLLSFLFVAALLGIAALLLVTVKDERLKPKTTLISFGIIWFFLTLAVESSLIPIRDVIFEHRLYLPSFGFFLATAAGAYLLFERLRVDGRLRAVLAAAVVLALSMATYQRNFVWKDEVSLWQDAVAKSPDKARPHNNLGTAYEQLGWMEEAAAQYQAAALAEPDHPAAQYNLANIYAGRGELDRAIEGYKLAIKAQSGYVGAHNNLANAYAKQGRLDKAIKEYQTVLKLEPKSTIARSNLANAYVQGGKFDQALKEHLVLLEDDPRSPELLYKIGLDYQGLGKPQEAADAFRTVLSIDSTFEPASQALKALSQ